MYLKKIEMQGFKSFADKTTISFEDSITAIVGPNGSGKSNVSDAIKWVLGEQSAKSLRGGKMEDIIFAGTDTRRPLGYAEVSMTFNNDSNLIPIDYSEVEVTRRMFRSGESEYFINKNSCRLRDVKELFMDTGIGKDGYSIIGQGKIDEILSDRPEDRRGIFEEAAGIVKFKTQKEESQRKLERTQENLIRINDLFQEVEKQNKSLEKDSYKAKKYLEIYNELKKSEITIFLHDIKIYKSKLSELTKNIDKYNEEIIEINKAKEQDLEKYNNTQTELENLYINIDFNRELISDKKNKIDELTASINISKEKLKYQNQELVRLNNELEEILNNVDEVKKTIKDKESSLVDITEKINLSNNTLIDKEKSLKELSEQLKNKEEILEQFKNDNLNLYNQTIEAKSKISSIDNFKLNINNRLEKINDNLNNLVDEKERISKDYEENNKVFDSLNREIEGITEEVNNIIFEKNNLQKLYTSKKEEFDNKRIDLQKNISNYNIYKNMEQAYEGYYKSVKNLLLAIDDKKIDSPGFKGVVADIIKVNNGYEKAIETTLGSSIQNVVVENDHNTKVLIDYLHKYKLGRVTFLPLNKISGSFLKLNMEELKSYNVLGIAKDFVDFDSDFDNLINYLLGRTVIVKDLESGLRLSKKYNYRIVTLEGDVFNPGGSITGGSYSKNVVSIISRKSKINSLEKEITLLKDEYNLLTENINDIVKKLEVHDDNLEEKNIILKEKLNKKDGLMALVNKLNMENENLKNQIERVNIEKDNLLTEIKIYSQEEENLKLILNETDKNEKKISKEIENATVEYEELKENYDNIYSEYTELKIENNNVNNTKSNVTSEIERLKNELEYSANQYENKKKDILDLKDNISDIDKFILKSNENLETLNKELEDETSKFNSLIENKNNLVKIKEELDLNIRRLTDSLYSISRKRDELDVEISKEKLQLENINKQLFVNYELDYESAIEFYQEGKDIAELRLVAEDLNKEVKKLGNINIDSINEYKEINERYNFLLEQQNDLVESRDNLETIIKDIEKEMSEKFTKSVEIINKNFEKIFKILFNGGKASIKIEDEDDILESGIEIVAQPPGKKLQNIRLLSGGEKSLTAVALLFAILEMKPSPFCILDEIDAALDDANIGRYTDYLQSLKDKTQFILITHRKTTMEISNILYGVTMEEEGVSKLYSLKMEDYLD